MTRDSWPVERGKRPYYTIVKGEIHAIQVIIEMTAELVRRRDALRDLLDLWERFGNGPWMEGRTRELQRLAEIRAIVTDHESRITSHA